MKGGRTRRGNHLHEVEFVLGLVGRGGVMKKIRTCIPLWLAGLRGVEGEGESES